MFIRFALALFLLCCLFPLFLGLFFLLFFLLSLQQLLLLFTRFFACRSLRLWIFLSHFSFGGLNVFGTIGTDVDIMLSEDWGMGKQGVEGVMRRGGY